MHQRILASMLLGLIAVAAVPPAAAQTEPEAAPTKPKVPGDGLAFEVLGGYFDMTNASRSATAVFGSSGGFTIGGGVRYGFSAHLYAEASGRGFSKSGERVFVEDAGRPVFRLGHPLDVSLTTIQATGGWRFRPGHSLVPYGGLGLG